MVKPTGIETVMRNQGISEANIAITMQALRNLNVDLDDSAVTVNGKSLTEFVRKDKHPQDFSKEDDVLIVLNYSEKTHALFGDFGGKYRRFKDEYLKANSDKYSYNGNLMFGPGWILKRKDYLKDLTKALRKGGFGVREVEYVKFLAECRKAKAAQDGSDSDGMDSDDYEAMAENLSSIKKNITGESDDEDEAPPPKIKKAKAKIESDDDEAPLPKAKKATKRMPKGKVPDEDSTDEDEAPPPKAKKPKAKKPKARPKAKVEEIDEEDEDEAPPPKAKKPKARPKAKVESEDEEDEAPPPKAKPKANVEPEDEEDEAPPPKGKASKKGKAVKEAPSTKKITKNQWGNFEDTKTAFVFKSLPIGKGGKQSTVVIGYQNPKPAKGLKGIETLLPLDEGLQEECTEKGYQYLTEEMIAKVKGVDKELAAQLKALYNRLDANLDDEDDDDDDDNSDDEDEDNSDDEDEDDE